MFHTSLDGNPGYIDHVKLEMIDHSIVVNLNCMKR